MIYPWSKAVVINLPSRKDRLEQFSLGAEKQEINFTTWPAMAHPLGAVGCLASHREVLRAFKDSGDECWAIFEDDCLFVDNFQELFHNFFDLVPVCWDALWLGGRHLDHPIRMHEHARVITKVSLSHAYVISHRAVDALLGLTERGLPGTSHVDKMWSDALGPRGLTYAPVPWLCGQSDGWSDIIQSHLSERWG